MDVLVFETDEWVITISTASIASAWQRFERRVKSDAQTYCDYSSSREGELSIFKINDNSLVSLNPGNERTEWLQQPPVLFETCKYQFAIEFKDSLDQTEVIKRYPKIRHQIKSIADVFKFYKSSDHSGFLVGDIDFLNSPGKFCFAFEYKDKKGYVREESIELYVVSPKLDTKNDLQQITKIINHEYENYVFDYLTLTFSSFSLKRSERNNNIIWLSIFKNVVDSYFKNIKYIMSRPNNKPIRKVYYSRPDRIRRWSQQQEERYKDFGTDAEMHYFRYEQTENTVNTRENRFVKYSLHILGKKFKQVFGEMKSLYADMAEEEKNDLEKYNALFKQLESSSFFKKVGDFEGFRQESAILQQRTGYSQVYKSWLMLKNSLDLIEGKTDIGMKKIWELYEIWCYLVMKRLIAKTLNLSLDPASEDKAHIRENKSEMINTFVNSGMMHTIEFDNVKNGDVVKLEYQHTYNRSTVDMKTTTTEQRPDIVVTITKNNGQNDFVLTYLYDAKYRVQDDIKDGQLDDGEDIDLADYPLPDAINQMHRYRDAIYYAMKDDVRPRGKEIIGGYILFPGRVEGDSIYNRYFYKSIEKVNIGAFPLLPADEDNEDDIIQCDLLENHLNNILLENSVYEHIKDSIPQKGLLYEPDKEGVLVVRSDNFTTTSDTIYVGINSNESSLTILSNLKEIKYLLILTGVNMSNNIFRELKSAPSLMNTHPLFSTINDGMPLYLECELSIKDLSGIDNIHYPYPYKNGAVGYTTMAKLIRDRI